MVYTSHAIITATLALSAAAPILAVPLSSTPGGTFLRLGNIGHGRLIRASDGATAYPEGDLELGVVAAPAAAHAAAPAAAPVTGLDTALRIAGVAGPVVSGMVLAGGLTLIGLKTIGVIRRAIDDEIYLAGRAGTEAAAKSSEIAGKSGGLGSRLTLEKQIT